MKVNYTNREIFILDQFNFIRQGPSNRSGQITKLGGMLE